MTRSEPLVETELRSALDGVGLVVERFERRVIADPGATALRCDGAELSFGELNAAANRIAHAIVDRLGPRSQAVGLLLRTGTTQAAAVLGTLKAGMAYVPLDPALAPDRLEAMAVEVSPPLLVCDAETASLGAELAGTAAILRADQVERAPDGSPNVSIQADDMAYVLFTSGSTGRPRGVAHTHRNLLHVVHSYERDARLQASDRLSFLYSFGFSAGIKDVFGGLLCGATLVPLDLPRHGVACLPAYLLSEAITVYHSVPSVFRALCSSLRATDIFPAVRLVSLGSEVVTAADAARVRAHFPNAEALHVEFGSTETGVVAQYFLPRGAPLPRGALPMGHPLPDKYVRLLAEDGAEVPDGEVGRIEVASRFLASGYFARPDLDQATFRPGPGGRRLFRMNDLARRLPDGSLEHCGRSDSLVKIRGQFVELNAIERALIELPELSAAAVVVREDRDEGPRIVAFAVPRGGRTPMATEIRRALRETLSAAMLPDDLLLLDALPVGLNGKLDRQALLARAALPVAAARPSAGDARPGIAAAGRAADPVEQILIHVFADRLEVDEIDREADILDLGGNSLVASQICVDLSDLFGAEVPLATLFDAPSIAALARVICTSVGEAAARERARTLLAEAVEAAEASTEVSQEPRGGGEGVTGA